MDRKLYVGDLTIDIRDDVRPSAIESLMDLLIMCYKHSKRNIAYSDGNIRLEGQTEIRNYAKSYENDDEELDF
jgi:hypothetical protein